MIGCASLLLVPVEKLADSSLPPLTLRALSIIQPVLLTALAVWIGEVTARCMGLRAPLIDAWLSGSGAGAVFRRQARPALLVGAVVALILISYEVTIGRSLLAGQPQLAGFQLPLVTKLLYGGITEELLTR